MKQVTGNQQLVEVNDADILDESIDASNYSWRRMKPESKQMYAYFKCYLMMPHPRKLARLAAQLRVSESFVRISSAKFKWISRASDYDDHHAAKLVEQARRYNQKREAEWAGRRDMQREAEWDIAQQLLDKVRLMLNVPLIRQTVTEYITDLESDNIEDKDLLEGLDKDAVVVIKKVIINEPLDWSAVDISRFFDVASKMARLATGMATDHKQVRIDVSKLTDEELENLTNE